MMASNKLNFPDLILLGDYNGNFSDYFDAVYQIFERDFIKSRPTFMGVVVSAQKHPLVDGKIHRTFYHITHEGADEKNRNPDLSRMERIKYPKFVITNSPHSELLIWENTRGRDRRVLIFNTNENYLVVLTKRRDYYLFWTAYIVDKNHNKRKLIREYEAYIKTKTA